MIQFEHFLAALTQAFAPMQLLALLIGSVIGVLIGALPGASATMGIAIMIPITYWTSPEFALILLMAVYTSGIFGGSISAILLNIPGTAASAATCFDGNPLARNGEGGKAIAVSIFSSFIAGSISAVGLLFLAPAIATVALKFGPLETAAIALFGLTVVASVSSSNMSKGLLMATFGMILGIIGVDPNTGATRFTFGQVSLYSGIPTIAFMIGCFSIPEAINITVSKGWEKVRWSKNDKISLRLSEVKTMGKAISLSTLIGLVIGLIPAVGPETATFVGYDQAKKMSKNPQKFGKGSIEGIAASEAANNAVVGTSLAPMFALGIPGSGAAMVLMGGLMVHGLQPGPMLFKEKPVLVLTLFLGFFGAQVFMLFIGRIMAQFAPAILKVENKILGPIILLVCIVSTFAISNNLFDVFVMLFGGIMAYVLCKAGFSMVPLILGLMLGPLFEEYLFRAVQISSGKGGLLKYFMDRPITWAILLLAIISIVIPQITQKRKRNRIKNED